MNDEIDDLPEHGIPVVRKYSVTHKRERESIRDVARQVSDWHGQHMTLRGDGANRAVRGRDGWAAGRARPDQVPCADAQCCSAESTISEWIASVIRKAESTNPDTHAESNR